MRRRDFLTISAAIAWPARAQAQQSTKITRIGFLSPGSAAGDAAYIQGFLQLLRELGYSQNKDIKIEFRWADGRFDRLPELAAELVRLELDVLVTYSNPGVLAAKQATATTPIVIAISGDAVASG